MAVTVVDGSLASSSSAASDTAAPDSTSYPITQPFNTQPSSSSIPVSTSSSLTAGPPRSSSNASSLPPPPVPLRQQFPPTGPVDDLTRRVHEFFAVPNNVFYMLLAHGFLCNGLVLAALGPSLLSLSNQTGATLQTIVYIFTARSLGHLVGTFVGQLNKQTVIGCRQFQDSRVILFIVLSAIFLSHIVCPVNLPVTSFGSLGGYVVDKWEFHQRSTVFVPMAFLALFTIIVPNCYSLSSLCLAIAFQGVCSGWIDNACQVLCIRFKTADKVSASPYLQGLHFFFAFGAVLSPFIFAGFLGNNALVTPNSDVEGSGESAENQYNQTGASTIADVTTRAISVASPAFVGGFYVIFVLILPGIAGLFYYVFMKQDTYEINLEDIKHCVTLQPGGLSRAEGHRGEQHHQLERSQIMGEVELTYAEDGAVPTHDVEQPQHLQQDDQQQQQQQHADVNEFEEHKESDSHDAAAAPAEHTVESGGSLKHRTMVQSLVNEGDGRHGMSGIAGGILAVLPHLSALGFVMVFFVSMILFFYAGMENYSNFIFTYAFSITGYTASTSAVINSMFWIAFAIGRAVAIPISHIWSPTKMLWYALLLCIFWMFILVFGPNSGGLFWFISIMYGLSAACVYPTTITWMEQYLKVTGKILSVMIMFECLGAASLPHAMSYALSNGGGYGDGFIFIIWFITIGAGVFFALLLLFVVPRLHGEDWLPSLRKAMMHQRELEAEHKEANAHAPGKWHS